jgi:hypothetical protein
VKKYLTRNVDKMSGFKQSIKIELREGGGIKNKPAWNNEGASLKIA